MRCGEPERHHGKFGLNMKKVIITGANGFIGFALTTRFNELGILVDAVVRSESRNLDRFEPLENVRVIKCNLDQIKRLPEQIITDDADVFYHFAWQGVADLDSGNFDIQMKNAQYASEAVKVAKELGAKKFVFASSIMEYEVMKLMETQLNADRRNIYRTAKLAAHYWTRIIANDVGIAYNAANISNVYGPGEISGRFINSTIRRMLQGERVKFTEAKQTYDFVYIDDAVDMLQLIGERGLPNKNYYVGSMKPRVLREYICELRDCIDRNLELGIGENPDFVGVSLDYNEFDIGACYEDFHYEPKHTFKEGICRTIEWIKG